MKRFFFDLSERIQEREIHHNSYGAKRAIADAVEWVEEGRGVNKLFKIA